MADQPKHRLHRARTLGIIGFLACAIIALVVWRSSSGRAKWNRHVQSLREDPPAVALDGETERQIVAFCSDCHGMPRADDYPRDVWHHKVQRGYEFYARSGRDDLEPPTMDSVVRFFRSRAPKHLAFPRPEEAEAELRVRFNVVDVALEPNAPLPPAVSHLRWARLEQDGHPVLLACDMRYGSVTAVDLRDRPPRPRRLARVNHPCHVDPCDLDGDGAIDLVVADLGSFFPDDHDRGRIVWLRRRKPSDTYEEVVIASALGRVADVRLADFDDDGDLDMIVAEFGAERRGNILLLRNVSAADGPPRFEAEEVDPRPGAIHVPLYDLDGDGRQDFVALISQEYECVEAFINQGNAQFHMQTLWAGPDPTFGSSGIELVDLDEDGDVDVLYTNGDAFDDNYAKLSHGVRWLENLGDLEFCHHRLTDLPGAHRALAGDVDLDGDLDVIATAFLPPQVMPPSLADVPPASIVCLEQTSPGTFVRHTLETDRPHHATSELADFDGDGDLDFAVGFHTATATSQLPYGLSVWWNQGRPTDE